MKGIIFNLVEDAVIAEYDEDTWASILEKAGADGGYTVLGNYPDEELAALVEAGSAVIGVAPAELSRGFGHSALLGLARRYPHFFQGFGSTRAFLLTLNDAIHGEVCKLHADAHPPEFWFDELADSGLRIHYRAERRLCALAEGMISGAASYFGETLRLTQTQCTLDGADHCLIEARFQEARPAMHPETLSADPAVVDTHAVSLPGQLERERTRRQQAGSMGGRVTSDLLFETVQRLQSAQSELLELADRERIVNEVVRELRQARDVEELTSVAAGSIGRVIQVDRCQVHVAGPPPTLGEWGVGNAPLPSRATTELYEANLERLFPEGAAGPRRIAVHDVETQIDGAPGNVRPISAALGMRGMVLVPLWASAQLIGCLALLSVTPRQWSDRDLGLCEDLARDICFDLVRLRSQENERMLSHRQALDRVKDTVIANVSHEFRTPMTGIRGYLELLQEGGLGPVPEPVAQAISVIDRNAVRLQRLIEDILAFSAAEAERERTGCPVVDLAGVVEACLESVRPQLEVKQLELRTQLHRARPWVKADPGHLERIVTNLMTNAIKFTPDGGGVTVRLNGENDVVHLSVSDTGIGIPEAEQAMVFDRFFRSSLSMTKEIQGVGMGLALTKALVERHDGEVTVSSIEGAGTTAVVTFPANEPPL